MLLAGRAIGDPDHETGWPLAIAGAGLDIGGTKIAAALVDAAGQAVAFETVPTEIDADAGAVLAAADGLIVRLRASATDRGLVVAGIGVAAPELVDLDGRVASVDVIPGLADAGLVHRWESVAPLAIESDVRAAAVAEARLGAGRGCSSFAYISVGTGVSYCLVIDGKPWTGSHGGAILLGSSTMAECQGSPWILEEIASGVAVLRRYRELGGELSSVADLLEAWCRDDSARTAIGEAARALGMGIALVINLLDPGLVVVGGGLGSAPGAFWELAQRSAKEFVYWDAARETPVVQAALGGKAGAIGAGLIGLGI
jgi:glucokinase